MGSAAKGEGMLRSIVLENAKRSFAAFPEEDLEDNGAVRNEPEELARMVKLRCKFNMNYRTANNHVGPMKEAERQKEKSSASRKGASKEPALGDEDGNSEISRQVAAASELPAATERPKLANGDGSQQLVAVGADSSKVSMEIQAAPVQVKKRLKTENPAVSNALALARDRPDWHPPWKLYRVLMGHLGWVRSVAVDPANEWFCTGSADRTIKIWDLASGKLRLTLTGHIGAVRGLCISDRHPYMFSAGDDKQVKCWDLEYNKVIRNYHGHLSGVYAAALHPSLDILVTGGRDATVRVWDMRTKAQIFALSGHRDAVNSVQTQKVDPQIISGSADSTIRLWDLAAGKSSSTLTNHKKGVRAVACHPREFSFASASADNIKTWRLPEGDFQRNLTGHNVIINSLSVNDDGVLVSGGDDGSIGFWDFKSAHEFYRTQTQVQPGSLDCEAGIFGSAFDMTGTRLITVETDKTVKMWKEDETATPETHPLNWKPNILPKRY